MMKNSYKMIFILSMMMGTIITISSSSWFSMWMGLEINLLSFIPLMMSSKNLFSSESSLKYFLTQALASTVFLFSVMLFMVPLNLKMESTSTINLLVCSTMLVKSGTAPFHFWFPSVMEGLSWNASLVLMTWQKLAPLMILSYCISLNLLICIIFLSMAFGSLGGLNQTSMRKLMAFSSINHLGWMISGMIYSETMWISYFLFYVLLSFNIILVLNNFKLFNINQTFSMYTNNKLMKSSMFITLLSLGGLPPFLGFFPKWLIMEVMTLMNLLFLLVFMMFFTLITLFFYLRVSYSALLMNNLKMNWTFNSFFLNKNLFFMLMSSFISLFGLLIVNLFYIFM